MSRGQRSEEPVEWRVDGDANASVNPADRGLAYGDGLFETMALVGGRIRWRDLHLERLAAGCRRLRIPAPDAAVLAAELDSASAGRERAVVKLIVTRGSGGRGYAPPPTAEPVRILGVFPWPAHAASHYTRGIVAMRCATTIGENEALAGLKHLGRLEQVLAQMELVDAGAEEGLVRRAGGAIVGGTSSNLFVVRAGRIATPRLDVCGVHGVMRRVVIETAAELGHAVTEADLYDDDLDAADELFTTNAVTGIRPIGRLDGREYPVGELTRTLASAVEAAGRA